MIDDGAGRRGGWLGLRFAAKLHNSTVPCWRDQKRRDPLAGAELIPIPYLIAYDHPLACRGGPDDGVIEARPHAQIGIAQDKHLDRHTIAAGLTKPRRD